MGNPITLNSTREAARGPGAEAFHRVASEAVRVQGETGYSQAIILSGACGSGKTYASMVLLRWGIKKSRRSMTNSIYIQTTV